MKKTYLLVLAFISVLSSYSQDIKMCGYQGYQTVDEVTSACDLQDATTSTNSTSDAEQVVDNILDKVGLFRNFFIEECDDINNALAVTMPLEGGDIERYILYDQDFFTKVSASTGTDWGNTSILAHEVGHHLNGHTLKSGGSNHKIELQADEFSGFVLARMNCSLEDAQSAISNLLPDEASSTHPAKKDRLAAIEKGWNRGNGKIIKVKKIADVKIELEEELNDEEITIAEENMVQAVLGKYIEAIGGQEKVAQIKTFYNSRVETMNMVIGGKDTQVSEMHTNMHSLKPAQIYIEMTGKLPTGEMKTEALIVNGKIYLKLSPEDNWQLNSNREYAQIKKSVSYIPEYSQLVNNTPANYMGIIEVKGVNCHVIKFDEDDLTTKSTINTTKYFNIENGLLFLEEQTLRENKSEIQAKKYFKNYKAVDGVLFSFQQEEELVLKNPGQVTNVKRFTTFKNIEINPNIDRSKFILEN
ncbi:MAG: hypothetical protein ACPG6B_06795 [Oceanihabitans sp.]